MILLTFGAVFGTVGLCLLLNETFLVRYYENSKQERLGSAYQEINELIGDRTEAILNGNWEPEREEEPDEEKEALLLELDILCERSDITVVIIKDILSKEQKPEAYVSYYFGNGNNPCKRGVFYKSYNLVAHWRSYPFYHLRKDYAKEGLPLSHPKHLTRLILSL